MFNWMDRGIADSTVELIHDKRLAQWGLSMARKR